MYVSPNRCLWEDAAFFLCPALGETTLGLGGNAPTTYVSFAVCDCTCELIHLFFQILRP
jgi:hypothetical protein